jgi:cyclopropane fatty-acyl-phospholipid synthase-like methyltransferase
MDTIFEANEAKAYETWLESRNGRHYLRATTELLDRLLDCQPGWRVLDVGCGLGLHLEHLRQRRQVLAHGLEAGPVMVRMASSEWVSGWRWTRATPMTCPMRTTSSTR